MVSALPWREALDLVMLSVSSRQSAIATLDKTCLTKELQSNPVNLKCLALEVSFRIFSSC